MGCYSITGLPQHKIRQYLFIYLGGERHCESKVSQEHKTMSPARAKTWKARSRVKCTNLEATMPWYYYPHLLHPSQYPLQTPTQIYSNFLNLWSISNSILLLNYTCFTFVKVIPRSEGLYTVTVHDVCLDSTGPAVVNVQVSDIYGVHVDVVNKVCAMQRCRE